MDFRRPQDFRMRSLPTQLKGRDKDPPLSRWRTCLGIGSVRSGLRTFDRTDRFVNLDACWTSAVVETRRRRSEA